MDNRGSSEQPRLVGGRIRALLFAAAFGLERLARHSKRRRRYRTAGFTTSPSWTWECPEGEHLHRRETTTATPVPLSREPPDMQLVPRKEGCTDSDEGREVAQPLDPWRIPKRGAFTAGSRSSSSPSLR